MRTILTQIETPLIRGEYGIFKTEAVEAWLDKMHRNTRLPIFSVHDLHGRFISEKFAKRYGYVTDMELRGKDLWGDVTWDKSTDAKTKQCEIRFNAKRIAFTETKDITSFRCESFILLDSTLRK